MRKNGVIHVIDTVLMPPMPKKDMTDMKDMKKDSTMMDKNDPAKKDPSKPNN